MWRTGRSLPALLRGEVVVEPSASSRVMARVLFDRFVSFMQAGFDENEAMILTNTYFRMVLEFQTKK